MLFHSTSTILVYLKEIELFCSIAVFLMRKYD